MKAIFTGVGLLTLAIIMGLALGFGIQAHAGGLANAVNSWNQIKDSYAEYHKMRPFDSAGNFQPNNIRIYMEGKGKPSPSEQQRYSAGNLVKEERQKYRVGGSGAIAAMPNYKLSPGLKNLFGLNGKAKKKHKWVILDEGVDIVWRKEGRTNPKVRTLPQLTRRQILAKWEDKPSSGKNWMDYEDPGDKRYVNAPVESPWRSLEKVVIGDIVRTDNGYEIHWFYFAKRSLVSSAGVREKDGDGSIFNLRHYDRPNPVWMSHNDFAVTHDSYAWRRGCKLRNPRILLGGKLRGGDLGEYLGDTEDGWSIYQGQKFSIELSEVHDNTITLMIEKDFAPESDWKKRRFWVQGGYVYVPIGGRKKVIKNIIINLGKK